MTTNNQTPPVADYGDSLMTVAQFCDRFPHLYPKRSRVRWLLRDRQSNGLIEYGAVIDVYANGSVPLILIHFPSWFTWLRAGGRRAPKVGATL